MKNYYQILHIEPDATKEDIKAAFKSLALALHPDKNQGGTEESNAKLRDVFEAKKVLLNDKDRSVHDKEWAKDKFKTGFNQQGMNDKKDMLAGLSDSEFMRFKSDMVRNILKDSKSVDKESMKAFESVESLRNDADKFLDMHEDLEPDEAKELLDGYSESEIKNLQTIMNRKIDDAAGKLDKTCAEYKELKDAFSEDKENINKIMTDKLTELRGGGTQEYDSPRPR